MATPIKITAPLSGRQSRIFNEKIAETSSKRVSEEEKRRMLKLMDKILSKK
jgi:hypothetical protein